MIKQIPKEEWYYDAFTWRGINDKDEAWYPVSYDSDGTAWSMTTNINNAMTFDTEKRAADMIKVPFARDTFFAFNYKTIEVVKVKAYPTFYFDFYKALSKLNIKLSKQGLEDFRNDSIKYLKENYGYTELDENDNKIIEVSHDNGTVFKDKAEEFDKNINKVKKLIVSDSIFPGTTYLLKTLTDIELVSLYVPSLKRLIYELDREDKSFFDWTENIKLPCFIVVDSNDKYTAYSLDETEEIINKSNKMLELIKKLKAKEKSK